MKLKELIESHLGDETWETLRDKTGISYGAMHRYRNTPDSDIKISNAIKIAKVLDFDMNEFKKLEE